MRGVCLAIFLALAGSAGLVHAAQGDRPESGVPTPTPEPRRKSAIEGGTTYVLQPRRYRPGHEFRLAAGVLPQDAFYKGTSADISYGYHFNDYLTWEVARGVYSWNHNTDLPRRLQDEFEVEPDPYEKVQYLISSHVQFVPFYGKQTFLNKVIVHHELYFLAGAGGVGWVQHESGRSDRPTQFRPAYHVGFGLRWYASDLVSFKLEGIENLYTKRDGSIDDQVYMSFGICLSSGRR